MKTLSEIMSRCREDGGCLIWSGGVCGSSIPCVRDDGRYVNLRRWVFEQSRGYAPRRGCVFMSCRCQRCLNPEHMRDKSHAEVLAITREESRLDTPEANAKKAAYWRERRGKLDFEKAREIRNSNETCAALAEKYHVHASLISRVKRGISWRQHARGASIFNL